MRFFNTAGPMKPEIHYCLDPLSRWNLEEILDLIQQEKYFVLHAPRQTGKTSCLLALAKLLNEGGQYRAVYANIEPAQAAREDVRMGIRTVADMIAESARYMLRDPGPENLLRTELAAAEPTALLERLLTLWCQDSPTPIILMLDEVDALIGDTLISLLRQLRSGYDKRPAGFPQSMILCGVRDVRDYRIHSSSDKSVITGGSAFNIKAESLRLGDFTREEMERLYHQHTEDTGQVFEPGALDVAWDLSCGQPWVANAIAYEVTYKIRENRDRTLLITAEMAETARENLILRRETHIDQLADKLREGRVRRVIEPMLAGEPLEGRAHQDDIDYVIDLGLIRRTPAGYAISNGLYREVIPRQLTSVTQADLQSQVDPAWYVNPNGRLDMVKLLESYQQFFRENFEHWVQGFEYHEAGPQLLLQAFLQRIVNGGGRVEREYAAGRGRMDLMVVWPVGSQVFRPGVPVQKAVIGFKVVGGPRWKGSRDTTLAEGLEQTARYMDRCATSEGHLLICDRDPEKPWAEKIWRRQERNGSYLITVWGL